MSNETEPMNIEGKDIDIDLLRPLNARNINFAANRGFRKILASIKAIGLIEPLSVYPDNGAFVILDGFLRYTVCKELGVKRVPCLIHKDNQAYTFNRNVNRLSGYQEVRMLRKSLETLDAKTIAATFGMTTIRHRLAPSLTKHLHPNVLAAFRDNLIGRTCAMEFTNTCHDRQLEMLADMKRVGDYSPTFCRTLVIQTPASRRAKKEVRKSWAEDDVRKQQMLARLQHAEKQHAFYAQLYRQYSTDLLKLVFYVRKMLANAKVESHLQSHNSEILVRFRQVVGEIG